MAAAFLYCLFGKVSFPVDHLLDNLAVGSVICANAAFDFLLADCFSRFFFI